MKTKIIISSLIGLLVGGLGVFGFIWYQIDSFPQEEFHAHADFAVFINGERFDFTRSEFMTNKPCIASDPLIPAALAHEGQHGDLNNSLREVLHLHDNNGSVVHVHKEGMTWRQFFQSLGMEFQDDFFIDNESHEYRATEISGFAFIVNGERVDALANREIQDLDRVLISYGDNNRPENELWKEYGQVTNEACIPSLSCPHRGIVPLESCGGIHKEPFICLLLPLSQCE